MGTVAEAARALEPAPPEHEYQPQLLHGTGHGQRTAHSPVPALDGKAPVTREAKDSTLSQGQEQQMLADVHRYRAEAKSMYPQRHLDQTSPSPTS